MTENQAPVPPAPNETEAHQVQFQVSAIPTEPARYANHVTLLQTQNELFIDFYFVAPPLTPGGILSEHVARIALATTVWRGLNEALAEQIDSYEKAWGVQVPNMRRRMPVEGSE